jgi:predicted O-methyltransferase YrrM
MFVKPQLIDDIKNGLQPDPWNGRWSQVMKFGGGNAVELEVGELLYGLVRALKPAVVAETGTHRGYSTLLIASALQANKVGHLYTVDVTDYGVPAVLLYYGLSDLVTFTKGDSAGMLSALNRKIDFLWLDADHGTEFVLRELAAAKPWLERGSYIAFHDTLTDPREAKAIAATRRDNPSWEYLSFGTARGFDLMRVA